MPCGILKIYLFTFNFLIMYLWVSLYVGVHMWAQMRGFGLPWGWSPKQRWVIRCRCWGQNLDPLQEQYALFATESGDRLCHVGTLKPEHLPSLLPVTCRCQRAETGIESSKLHLLRELGIWEDGGLTSRDLSWVSSPEGRLYRGIGKRTKVSNHPGAQAGPSGQVVSPGFESFDV